MDKLQINVRLSQEQIDAIDRKRVDLLPMMGKIPNRSEVLRFALEQYLAGDKPRGDTAKSTQSRHQK